MLGFAWPHMTFASVDDLKLVIMANVWPPWHPTSHHLSQNSLAEGDICLSLPLCKDSPDTC